MKVKVWEEGGKMINFSGVSLPFNVGDLIGSGSALLGLIGPFVLAAIVFYF